LSLNGWSQGVAIRNNRAYVACRASGIATVDITVPTSPVLLSMYEPRPNNVRGVWIQDTILYAVSDNYGLYTYSISNSDTLRPLGSLSLIGYRIHVVDTLAFIVGTHLLVVNVSDPANPRLVSSTPPPNNITPSFRNIAVSNNRAYCVNYNVVDEPHNGVYLLNLTNANQPVCTGQDLPNSTTQTFQGPFGVASLGTKCLVTYTNYLRIVDTAENGTLLLASEYPMTFGHAWNAKLIDTLMYVATDSGLKVFSYSNLSYAGEYFSGLKPDQPELAQNYPNPFNPSTTIRYSVPASGLVTLTVHDVSGRQVASLVHEMQNAGAYAVSYSASDLPSAMYFYRLQAKQFVSVKKMLFVK
jgi:hypothetical protein